LARLEYYLEFIIKKLNGNDEELSKVITNIINSIKTSRSVDPIDDLIYSLLIKLLQDEVIVQKTKELINKYGNAIWAIPIVSNLFVEFLTKIRPDVVLTNPPWLKLSELPDSRWGKKLHEYVREKIVSSYRKTIPGISKAGMSGDISAIFLLTIMKILEKDGYIGIVLPAEQSYTPKSPHGAGKLLTYAVLNKYKVDGSVVYVGDAFKHGRHASVLILRVRKIE
jgi:hypothetical protein